MEPPAQPLFTLVEGIAQRLLDRMVKSDAEKSCWVANCEGGVTMLRLLHAEHRSLKGHPLHLLETAGGKVAEHFGDEIVGLQARRGEVEFARTATVQEDTTR